MTLHLLFQLPPVARCRPRAGERLRREAGWPHRAGQQGAAGAVRAGGQRLSRAGLWSGTLVWQLLQPNTAGSRRPHQSGILALREQAELWRGHTGWGGIWWNGGCPSTLIKEERLWILQQQQSAGSCQNVWFHSAEALNETQSCCVRVVVDAESGFCLF